MNWWLHYSQQCYNRGGERGGEVLHTCGTYISLCSFKTKDNSASWTDPGFLALTCQPLRDQHLAASPNRDPAEHHHHASAIRRTAQRACTVGHRLSPHSHTSLGTQSLCSCSGCPLLMWIMQYVGKCFTSWQLLQLYPGYWEEPWRLRTRSLAALATPQARDPVHQPAWR